MMLILDAKEKDDGLCVMEAYSQFITYLFKLLSDFFEIQKYCEL